MRIGDATLEKILQSGGKATTEQLEELKDIAAKTHRPLQDIAIQRELVGSTELTKLFAAYTKIPFVQIEPRDIPTEVLNKVPERIAAQYMAILFSTDEDGTMHLAMEDPDDIQGLDFIKKQVGTNLKVYIASRDNILDCLQNYRGDMNEQLTEAIDIQSVDDGGAQGVDEKEISEDSPVAQTVNLLLEYAIRSSASDIHIEPREEYIQIRYRIDGVLKEVNRLPRSALGALTSRVKILSNLKIDERRVPQDGRFKIKFAGKQYAFRVSTLPISDGEKVVMRILDESNQAISLQSLGYWGRALAIVNEAMTQANGIVLVTGPTGSGKSTSLFSILTELNKPDVNISTIEDPVEYKIQGVNQTQTNSKAGMTFASGLRALLRQDPNIIMVGEIRDGETANLGVQAALTGHLVFSTLHTNNAATTLPRLLDMGIEPFLIASTVRAVVGQRLVRRLCMSCRYQVSLSTEEQAAIASTFKLSEPEALKHLHELENDAKNDGMDKEAPLSTDGVSVKTVWKSAENGCDQCNNTGYKGRIGIYEVLSNSREVQKLIVSNATSNHIQDQAISDGMVVMQIDGLVKVLRGQTTVEEILRATKES